MSNFKVNEIKSWAKRHGIVFKKQGEGYVWAKEGQGFDSPPESMDRAVTSIFNEITSGKFKEHQENYKAAP